ncbi:oligosaccharide flippase family protein [Arenibacter sp. 6A1]|uniref:oligosaccharide flippase family protein n=1 Tax=Arenibacter sp. 6A1 TaxID=2720391 RepID=UPI001446EABB|nr:oligosaccharide flippase family protein [Arenibacter sp. 6A1]NKI26854.1 oligosaccharide flippase family protein [Arenibacter sp. 6A1]
MPGYLNIKSRFSKEINELLSSSFWSLVGSLSSKSLLFAVWVLVARMLGKELYGEIGIVRSTINLFIIFLGTGISITMTKYIPMYVQKDKQRVSKIYSLNLFFTLSFSALLTFLLYFLAEYISIWISGSKDLKLSLQIGSFLIFFNSLNSFITGCLQGFRTFKLISFINTINGVATFVFVYLGAYFYSVHGAFIGLLISAVILLIQSHYYLKKKLKQEGIEFNSNFISEFTILKNFTVPSILSGLMVVPFKWALDAFLVKSTNGLNELGLYSALILFQTFLVVLANSLNAPLLTLMAENKNNNSINKISIYGPLFLGITLVIPFLFFPQIFGFFLGSEYVNDPNYNQTMILILITTILMLYKQGIARIMVINNLMWFSFCSNLIWGLVLLMTFKLSNIKDARTFAFSYFIAYVINILVIIPYYTKKGIIPKKYVANLAMFALWILLGIISIVLYFNNFSIIINLLGFFVSLAAFFGIFFKLIKK